MMMLLAKTAGLCLFHPVSDTMFSLLPLYLFLWYRPYRRPGNVLRLKVSFLYVMPSFHFLSFPSLTPGFSQYLIICQIMVTFNSFPFYFPYVHSLLLLFTLLTFLPRFKVYLQVSYTTPDTMSSRTSVFVICSVMVTLGMIRLHFVLLFSDSRFACKY